ncbi:MAG TPA: vanadium-dependent haloperoxidase [Phytomonospora sp.]
MTGQFTDPVLRWNAELIDAIRAGGGPPTTITRTAAIVHVAMYDAAVTVARTATPYALRFPPYVDGVEPSLEAAINQAAYQALRTLFPGRDFTFALDEATSRLGSRVRPVPLIRGAAIGTAAAEAVLRKRSGDGSEVSPPYVAVLEPGAWRPTGSGAAASPHWGLVTPWALNSGDQFRPQPPNDADNYEKLLASGFYERQVEEVRELGGRESSRRTPDETEQAFFWANDLDGTYKPPGQHFEHTRIVSLARGLSVLENVRLFALVAMAMADATIAAWDAKYLSGIDLWRPETAVRHADEDGRPGTEPDEDWRPLSQDRLGFSFSPPFPAYVSGHATLAGAWATTMRLFLGEDAIAFEGTTDDPHAKDVVRRFESFTEAAEEDARSRVFLGVHYQVDADGGLDLGRNVAEHVYANRLQ